MPGGQLIKQIKITTFNVHPSSNYSLLLLKWAGHKKGFIDHDPFFLSKSRDLWKYTMVLILEKIAWFKM